MSALPTVPSSIVSFAKVIAFSVLLVTFFYSSETAAQTEGLSLKPASTKETVDPGEIKNYTIRVTNLDSEDKNYFLFTRNVSDVRDGGVPVFADSNSEVTGFELADWVTLSKEEILVPGGGSTQFDVSVAVPENASPGAHLGGIFVSVEPPKIEGSGAAVGYQVVSMLSLRVAGDIVENASIRQFSTGKFLYGSQNVDFNVRIQNTGNVLVEPVGPLEITNMFGSTVDTIVFNETQKAIVPNKDFNSTREFNNIMWEGDSVGFGRYEAILSLTYGDVGAKKTMSSTVSFWILPINIIGPALGVLAVILLIIFISVKLYIRRSLAHLNNGRRLVRRRRKGNSAALLITVVMLTATALFLIVLLALFA